MAAWERTIRLFPAQPDIPTCNLPSIKRTFLAKNPSGYCKLSQSGEIIIRPLKGPFRLVGIGILDYIIVAGGDTASFFERGLL